MKEKPSCEEREKRLRADGLRLKAMASQMSTAQWIETFLGVVERERVGEVERYKEKEFVKRQERLAAATGVSYSEA